MNDNRSSGDLIADRRFGYGQALRDENDFAGAADLFGQTLELVPSWPPAWFALGDAQEQNGNREGAIRSFQKSLALAPDDVLGASLRLTRLGALPAANAMTQGYIAALFDQYADRFDDHLVKALAYRGPEIITATLQTICAEQQRGFFFDSALDIGCGTGLMAKAMAARSTNIDGIDLSPAMVAAASKTGHYRAVWAGDCVECMNNNARSYSLIMAADVLVYIGDLQPLFARAATMLERDGLLSFTVQSHDGDGFVLGDDLRYHHSEAYLRICAGIAGFSVLHLQPCITRQDAGKPVLGFVGVLAMADTTDDA
jgi:predicted TPR repeat methyltransferase